MELGKKSIRQRRERERKTAKNTLQQRQKNLENNIKKEY
jgi:hypothetical protein